MFWVDLVVVLAITLSIAGLFGMGRRKPGAGLDVLVFFLLLFFATWAVGGWFQPLGPPLWGAYWIPYLIAAVLIGMLLCAVMEAAGSPRIPQTPADRREEAKAEEAAARAFGAFFWVFLVVALTAITVKYVLTA